MSDSMGPGKLVHHMQNPSYTYDEYLICIKIVRHMQKSVIQWSVISKFTCTTVTTSTSTTSTSNLFDLGD